MRCGIGVGRGAGATGLAGTFGARHGGIQRSCRHHPGSHQRDGLGGILANGPRGCGRAEALGRLDFFDGDLGLGGTPDAGRDVGRRARQRLGALPALGGRSVVVGCLLICDECALEGFVADVGFESGVVLVVLAEQALALLPGRGRGVVLVQVAAVMAVAVVVLQVKAHQVLVRVPQASGDGAEGGRGDDEQRGEGQQSVDHDGNCRVECGQRGGGEVPEHAAGPAQSVEAVGHRRLAADDVGQTGTGEGHDEEADADPVVAAAVVGLAEQAEGTDEQHERKQQGHPAERAVDDREHEIGKPAMEAPPRERGDEDPQGQIEQRGAVAAVPGVEVADVVADPADAGADDVGDAEPGAGQHPHNPGLVRLDGGQLPGPRGGCGSTCGAAGGSPRPGGFGCGGAGPPAGRTA